MRKYENYMRKYVNYMRKDLNYMRTSANYMRKYANYMRKHLNYIHFFLGSGGPKVNISLKNIFFFKPIENELSSAVAGQKGTLFFRKHFL